MDLKLKYLEGVAIMNITITAKKVDEQKLSKSLEKDKHKFTLIGEGFAKRRSDYKWLNIGVFTSEFGEIKSDRFVKQNIGYNSKIHLYNIKHLYRNKYSLTIYPNQFNQSKEIISMSTALNYLQDTFNELKELGLEVDVNSCCPNYFKLIKKIDIGSNANDYKEAMRIIAASNRNGTLYPALDGVKIGRIKKDIDINSSKPTYYTSDTIIQSEQRYFNLLDLKVQDNNLILTTEIDFRDFKKIAKKLKIDIEDMSMEMLVTDKKCVELFEKMALDNINYVFKSVHKQIDKTKSFLIDKLSSAEDREDVIAIMGQVAYDKKGIGYIDNLLLAEAIYNSKLTTATNYSRYMKDLFIKWNKNGDNERNALIRNANIIEKINYISSNFNIPNYKINLSKQSINVLTKTLNSLKN